MTIAYGARQPCDEHAAGRRDAPIPCPERDKPWVLATAILGSSLAFLEGSVVNLALPAIQSDFETTSTELQWVINAYLLVLGSFMLIGGSLGDRYGLRRVFLVGTAVFGAGALAAALAPSMSLLIAARILQGIGGALLVPSSLALVGSHFPKEERGRAIGTWAGASALTTAAGPVLGGWLVDRWGWPSVFFLVVPVAILTIIVCRWRVPVSPVKRGNRLDYAGGLLLVASLALLIYALVSSQSLLLKVAAVVLSLVLGAAFLLHEKRFKPPMLPLRLFSSGAFSGANLMTLLLYSALTGALYFLPFNLIQVQGYSAAQAGAAFLPFTLILGFGSTLAGDMIRKFDPRMILTVGPVVAAAGFITLAIPGENASYVSGFLPGILIIGVGMTLSVAPLTTVVMGSVSNSEAGIASGVNNTAARIAGVLAVAVLTAVAVWQFTDAIELRLQDRHVPRELTDLLTSRASELADLKAPEGTSERLAATASDAVAFAYVRTFRLLVVICGLLAAVSGAIAWFSLAQYDRKDE